MRPKQWIKNTFVFAALVFVLAFTDVEKIMLALAAFAVFCLASSGVYIINDIVDRHMDRRHPKKRLRPIAAGRLRISHARLAGAFLLAIALVGGFFINIFFGWIVTVFMVLNLLYSFALKHVVILDVISVALGFVLRVVAGAVAIRVVFSPWIVFCTFFLTLFLAISKRRSELLYADGGRHVLAKYSIPFLNQMNAIVLPLTLTTYTFYTFSSEHSRLLMITVPIVLYGLFRYLYILQQKETSDDGPVDDFFSDKSLQATVLLWAATVFFVLLYF